ncbi:MAG: endonuclease/exonuclease/phosphatase family protein [Phycisphaerales bacterium]|nr:endonuclease/exonuclease/phosphatase family protein [Phycisphaerales bacterium]
MGAPPASLSPRLILNWICLLGLASILGALLLGRLAFLFQYFDWFSHFPSTYLLVATGLTIVLLIIRQWMSSLFGFFVVTFCLLVLAGPFTTIRMNPDRIGDTKLTVAVLNVLASNQNAKATLELLPDADVVGLLETPTSWTTALDEAEQRWPRQWRDLRDNPTGMTILGGDQIQSAHWFMLTPGAMPAMHLELNVEGIPVHLIIVHTMSPQSPGMLNTRDIQFRQLENMLDNLEGNLILMGDLNASTWSPSLQLLMKKTGLRSFRASSGTDGAFMGTWPRWAPAWLRIPIDHCLIRGDIEPVNQELFLVPGADHLGLYVELVMGEHSTRPEPEEQARRNHSHPIPLFWRHVTAD